MQTKHVKTNRMGIELPVYALCLMIISMVLMLVAIIILAIQLKKKKSNDNEYKVFTRANTSTSIALDKSDYQRQDSREFNTLKTSPKIHSDCESVKVDDPFVKHACSIRNISQSETTSSTNVVSLPPRNRKPVPASVILPEQMKAICRDVLNKRPTENSTSSRDITDMLHEFSKLDKSPTSRDKPNGMIEKSMSTPDLDIYDCPPSRKPEEINKMYKELENDDADDIPVYDSLPTPYLSPKQSVVVDQDTQYLLPISGPAEDEPAYINANRNNYML